MKLPFRRKRSLPERLLQAVAKFAGIVRLAMKRRALRRLPRARTSRTA